MSPSRGILALLAVLTLTAGCLGGATSDDRAAEIANRTLNAMGDVDTVTWTAEGSAEAERGGETSSVSIRGEGRIDYATKRAMVSVEGDGESTTIALENRTTYATCPAPGAEEPERWYDAGDLPEDMTFRDAAAVASPTLFDISTYEYDGNRTIDGTLYHRIVLEPDPDEYGQYKARAMYPGQDASQFTG